VKKAVRPFGLVAAALLWLAALNLGGLPPLAMGILLVATPAEEAHDADALAEALLAHCRRELPNFMVPGRIVVRENLPHNQNGKIDRRALGEEYADSFREAS